MGHFRHWGPIIGLLLLQLALRVYHPAALPVFVDEYSHIGRAQIAFERSLIPYSHGKLLFYYWLAPVVPQGDGALSAARLAVALISLVSSAAAAAVARDLFGRRAILPTLAFYAVVPYAAFFERMALADPFAGALAALAVWSSVHLARRPSVLRGLLTGLLISLMLLAKLTTGVLGLMPLLAVILFGKKFSLPVLWRSYRWAGASGVLVIALIWGYVFVEASNGRVSGGNPILMDTYLLAENGHADSLSDKVGDVVQRGDLLLSIPMSLVLIGFAGLILWRRPKPGIYVLSWLLLLWIPMVVMIIVVQSRYLMTGIPALAALFGGGIAIVWDELDRYKPRLSAPVIGGLIGGWMLLFALPFDVRAMTDPAVLTMPDRDTHDYFNGPYNAWGVREGIEYLLAHGESDANGQIPVVALIQHCGLPGMQPMGTIYWQCIDPWDFAHARVPADGNEWLTNSDLRRFFAVERSSFYLLTDRTELLPPASSDYTWTHLYSFQRPHGGRTISVWRLER